MRLEPLEFKQCLVSLGYNLKEGDKVGQLFSFPCELGCSKTVEAEIQKGKGNLDNKQLS